MTEKVARCENCAIRRYSDKHPNSVVSSVWRWHTGWCPGWKSYQSTLPSQKAAAPRNNQAAVSSRPSSQAGGQAGKGGPNRNNGPGRKQNGGQKGGKNQNPNKPRGKGKKGKK